MMNNISEKYAGRRKEKTEIYLKVFYEQEDASTRRKIQII